MSLVDTMLQSFLHSQNSTNPIIQNALKLYQEHDTEGLKSLAENMCKERGISIYDLRRQLGL